MDDKELKYSHVLYKLRKMTPVMNDGEQLTEKIMQRIEQTISSAENHHAASSLTGTKGRRGEGTKGRRGEGTKGRRGEGTKGRRHEGAKAENHHAASGKNRVMRIAGILSGVAASALICLFAYDSLKYPVLPIEISTKVSKAELFNNMLYERSNEEKADIIVAKLKSRKTQRARNERLVSVFVNRMKSQ